MSDGTEASRKRFGLGLILTAVLMATLFAVAVMLFFLSGSRSTALVQLDQKLFLLRSNGVPMTAREIAEVFPDPPPENDARVLLKTAFSLLPPNSRTPTNLPLVAEVRLDRTDRIPEGMLREMEVHLTNSDAILVSLPDSGEKVWFSVGWQNGFTNLLPVNFIQIRSLQQTLTLKALYEAELGRAARAGEALRKSFSFLGMLRDDTLVDSMIGVACAGLIASALEQVMNRTRLNDEDLGELQKVIRPEACGDFQRTFLVERHIGLFAFEPMRRAYQNKRTSALLTTRDKLDALRGLRRSLYRDADFLLFLETVDQRAALHDVTGLEQIRRHAELDESYRTNATSVVTQMVAPSWAKAARAAVETKARLVCAKTAVAIERFRAQHSDALPATLHELVPAFLPELPTDPLDGQPLRYRRLERGFVLYSIGADGVDDGGKERVSFSMTNGYDVTFIVER